jgi:hypothetical protein
MKRLLSVAFVLLISAAALFVVTRGQLVGADADDAFRATAAERQREVEHETLRDRYVERLKAKADLMSDEEVQKALEETESSIRFIQAKRKLDETAATLRTIMQEFDGTPFAKVAEDMLAVHERGPVPEFENALPFSPPTPTLDVRVPTRSSGQF